MSNPLNLTSFIPPEYENLSSAEQAIGVSSSGKTIYKRVFTGTSGTQVAEGAVDGSTYITTFNNNEQLLNAYGFMNWYESSSSKGTVLLPYFANRNSYAIVHLYSDKKVYLTFRNTTLNNQSYLVVLVYSR